MSVDLAKLDALARCRLCGKVKGTPLAFCTWCSTEKKIEIDAGELAELVAIALGSAAAAAEAARARGDLAALQRRWGARLQVLEDALRPFARSWRSALAAIPGHFPEVSVSHGDFKRAYEALGESKP